MNFDDGMDFGKKILLMKNFILFVNFRTFRNYVQLHGEKCGNLSTI